MPSPRIALIHATPVAIDPIVGAFRRLWPEARLTNLLEDSLAPDLAADGRLTDRMIGRFVMLASYVHDCGADAILFTCSAFGPAIEAARAALNIPVLKPNEAMLEQAELEHSAKEKNDRLSITSRAVPAALAALHAGRADEHDRLIAAAAEEIGDCDALILGQFSMASAASIIRPHGKRKVLTSPTAAVMQLKQLLSD
jgi:hypothetical protein